MDASRDLDTERIGLTALCAAEAAAPTGDLPFISEADAVSVQVPQGYRVAEATLRVTYNLDAWTTDGLGDPSCEDVVQFEEVQAAAHVQTSVLQPTAWSDYLTSRALAVTAAPIEWEDLTPGGPDDEARLACGQAWSRHLRDGVEQSFVFPIEIREALDPALAAAALKQHRASFEARIASQYAGSACARAYWKAALRDPKRVMLDASAWSLEMTLEGPDGARITRTVGDSFVIGN